ncbi:caspase family protein [Candidatus Uabimicrobium amorphum]|nr:caspase family protein [Candidatus Uabimicrobium amorphum]
MKTLFSQSQITIKKLRALTTKTTLSVWRKVLFIVMVFLVNNVAFAQESNEKLHEIFIALCSDHQQKSTAAMHELIMLSKNSPTLTRVLQKIAIQDSREWIRTLAKNALQSSSQSVQKLIDDLYPTEKTRASGLHKSKSLGGLTILGASHDFRQRLRYGKKHALVIGINQYEKYSDLQGPNFDAAAVASVLVRRYGFDDVVLLTDTSPQNIYRTTEKWSIRAVNKQTIADYLAMLRSGKERGNYKVRLSQVDKDDALFVFFAGHGIPGYIVAADSHNESTAISLRWLAEELAKCRAQHTFLVLDCCFSGSIFSPPFRPRLGAFDVKMDFHRGENIDRVFRRRCFQIVTAGTGGEVVADQLRLSSIYAQKNRNLRGHSPFTAIFLQALEGLVGREDGIVLTSDLGYYMGTTLVNDRRIDALQTPRYQSLGGDGDFMFFPAHKVLNPRLLQMLYLDEQKYAEIKRSTCAAIQKFILEQPRNDHLPLTRSAVIHMSKLLEESQFLTYQGAVQFIYNMLHEQKMDIAQIPEYSSVVLPLANLLDKTLSATKSPQRTQIMRKISYCLAALDLYTNEIAVNALREYIHFQDAEWKKYRQTRHIPTSVLLYKEKLSKLRITAESLSEQMRIYAKKNAIYLWLHTKGRQQIEEYQHNLVQSRSLAQTVLQKAKEAYQQKKWEQCGAYAGKALQVVKEYPPLHSLRQKAHTYVRLSMWHSATLWKKYSHSKSVFGQNAAKNAHRAQIYALKYSHNSQTLASASYDESIKLWRAQDGVFLRDIFPTMQHQPLQIEASSKANILAILTGGGFIEVYDLVLKKLISTIKIGKVERPIMAISSDGKTIALSDQSEKITLYSVARAKKQRELVGHKDDVTTLAFSPDNQWLASGALDHDICLWNLQNNRNKILSAHKNAVIQLSFSYHGELLASCSQRNTLVWDLKKHQVDLIIPVTRYQRFTAVAFSRDDRLLACGTSKNIELFDIAAAKLTLQIPTKMHSSFLCFHPSGKILLAHQHFLGAVVAWDSKNGKKLYTITSDARTTSMKARFSADGKSVIVSARGIEKNIQFFDALNGEKQKPPLKEWFRHVILPKKMAFGKRLLATSSKEGTLIIWNAKTAEAQHIIYEKNIDKLTFSSDDSILACTVHKQIYLYNTDTGKLLHKLPGHQNKINSLSFFPTKPVLLSAGNDNKIKFWSSDNGTLLQTLPTQNRGVLTYFCNDQRTLALLSGYENINVQLSDIYSKQSHNYTLNTTKRVYARLLSQNGAILAIDGGDTYEIWDVRNERRLRTSIQKNMRQLALAPDGTTFAYTNAQHTLQLCKIRPLPQRVFLPAKRYQHIAMGSQGKFLAFSSADELGIWDTHTNKLHKSFKGYNGEIKSLALSHDGKILASAGEFQDPLVRLWETTTGKLRHALDPGDKRLDQVAFSHDGKSVGVSVSGNQVSIVLWDSDSGKKRRVISSPNHQSAAQTFLAFSPQQSILAWARDNEIDLWDATSGRRICQVATNNPVNKIFFDATGKNLVLVNPSAIALWNLQQRKVIAQFRDQYINDGALTTTSKYLAAATSNGVQIWDVITGEKIQRFHETRIFDKVAFHPKKPWLTCIDHNAASRIKPQKESLFFYDLAELMQVHTSKNMPRYAAHRKSNLLLVKNAQKESLWNLHNGVKMSKNISFTNAKKIHLPQKYFAYPRQDIPADIIEFALQETPKRFTEQLFGYRVAEDLSVE